MIIKKMTLINFRQYKGENALLFSTDHEKNVTVVLGKNTSGKTTLLQAFIFCLYGNTTFTKKESLDLLNYDLKDSLQENQIGPVKVEIELTHLNFDYRIIRELKFQKKNSRMCIDIDKFTICKVNEDGNSMFIESDSDKIEEINKIMPKELSPYFLFDGERVQNIAKKELEGKKDISNAIKSILGLKLFENVLKHFNEKYKNSVTNRFLEGYQDSTDEKTKQISIKIQELISKSETLQVRISEFEKNSKYFEELELQLNNKLQDLNEIKYLTRERENLNRQVNDIEKEQNSINEELKKMFSTLSFGFFIQPLFFKSLKQIKDSDVSFIGEAIPNMNAKAIDYIIERGVCICGSKINEDSECYNNLLHEKELLPPKYIGTVIREFSNYGKLWVDSAVSFYSDFVNKYKTLLKKQNDLSEHRKKIDEIHEKIKDFANIGEIEKQREESRVKFVEFKSKIKKTEIELSELEEDINFNNKQLKELSQSSERNKKILNYMQYCTYVKDAIETRYNLYERNVREKLNERVNYYLTKMYHGERSVKIDSSYNYELLIKNHQSNEELNAESSRGLEVITSFSFICGIIDLAKQKLNNGIDFNYQDEPYPLIMDAPFSNTDEEHVKRIVETIPNVANQIILFMMHKDWKLTHDKFKNKINHLYEIEKKTETYSLIQEVKNDF